MGGVRHKGMKMWRRRVLTPFPTACVGERAGDRGVFHSLFS